MQAAAPFVATASIATRDASAGNVQACFHCGTACPDQNLAQGGKRFCCAGCQTVYELLTENGLGQFYELGPRSGARVESEVAADKYGFLDEQSVRARFVDFSDERTTRVSFSLPGIHCVACVWLLENLFRLKPGVGETSVNFARQEARISFDPGQVRLSEMAALLDSIGYAPELKLADLDGRQPARISRRLWLQLGVAGFVFGNTMLFSIPSYFGLDSLDGPAFRALVGWLSLGLSFPVVLFSAFDYWRASWFSLKQRRLTIDVPIAAGIAAIFVQSCYEVVSGHGEGYFDSLAGLLFFLLCGRIFQQKTYDRLAFDRDYRSFFPLSVLRLRSSRREEALNNSAFRTPHSALEKSLLTSAATDSMTERVALAQLAVGDHLIIRHGELIPADSRLVEGTAVVDYSFVTGEAQPVTRQAGELLYAGGRQAGGAIEVETVKPVSQGYLTSLWNQDAFRKEKGDSFNTLTNRYSQRFTWIILFIALAAAGYWAWADPTKSLRSFTGVLIVACPCALALAAPFTLGAALRALARRQIFVRNGEVLETLARVDSVVFDKTGTLTVAQGGAVRFAGTELSAEEASLVRALAGQSTHPLAARVVNWLGAETPGAGVTDFRELPGNGVEANVAGRRVALGSARFIAQHTDQALEFPEAGATAGSCVHVALDGAYRGCFVIASSVRPETAALLKQLSLGHELALLSGDNERDRDCFRELFGPQAGLHFNQSPLDKLSFVRGLQSRGRTVLMVGDGLNDAGALKQSDVGVAVVENVGAFSPASDVIMASGQVPRTGELLRLSRHVVRVVRASFLISTLYNVVGLSIAVTGNLSPIVCAILMPLSSVTVVAFAVGVTHWLASRAGFEPGVTALPHRPSSRDRDGLESDAPLNSINAKFAAKEGEPA
jgi:Cu+-exporting ATPase